jgi:hypothetical protein
LYGIDRYFLGAFEVLGAGIRVCMVVCGLVVLEAAAGAMRADCECCSAFETALSVVLEAAG